MKSMDFVFVTSNLKTRIGTFQKGEPRPYYANSMLQNNVFAIWKKIPYFPIITYVKPIFSTYAYKYYMTS